MKLRSLLVGMVAAALLGVAAPAAMAEDFCVGVTIPRCPVETHPLTHGDLVSAVVDANDDPGPDTVVIATHTFNLAVPIALYPAADTSIVGAGVGQTVFAGAFPSQPLVQVFGSAGSAMRGFSVDVNDDAASGTGLDIRRTNVSDFAVNKSNDIASSDFVGMKVGDGATVSDGTVKVLSNVATGVLTNYKSATLENVTIESEPFLGNTAGLIADSSDAGAELNFRHVRIRNFFTAAGVNDKHVTFTDSLIDMGTLTNAVGLAASANGGKVIDLDVERVLVVGRADHQTAFSFFSDSAPSNLDITLYDFVAYVPGPTFDDTFKAISCAGGSGSPQPVDIDIEYFASWGGDSQIDPGCSWDLEGPKATNFIDGLPEFRDFAGGDYRLLHTSPLIDKGATAGTLTASATDLAGGKRAIDGDGDGTAKTDLGAFEYQRSAPSLVLTASTGSAAPGQPVTFTAAADDLEDEGITYSWNFGDGATAGNVTPVAHSFATFGTYAVSATATDESGASSARTVEIKVPAPPVLGPAVASARVTAKATESFKAGKKGFSVAKKGQPSFTVTFANAAKARLTVQSIGKKKKLKSTKVSSTIPVKDGATRIFFGGGKLKAGKYRVTIMPLSPTGLPGKPATTDIKLK